MRAIIIILISCSVALTGCAGFAFTPPLSEPSDKKNAEAAGHSAHDGE